ncbi:MAG: hypothetical protein QOH95_297, partial [Gaiellaceae bacterium]|nr:hypothetical protein [Gaiellaceae bacterium]
MSRAAVVVVALTALVSGCGGSGLRGDLAATGDNMGKIRAGTIDFSMLVTPRAAKARNPFGWKLKGPFVFGDTPTAHVVYTQIANGHTADVVLVMDVSGGYASVDGKRKSLTDSNLKELRGSAGRVRAGASIDISKWIKSASSCGARCARGDLDVAAAANTLLQISGSTKTLTDAESKQLADATRDANYRVEW